MDFPFEEKPSIHFPGLSETDTHFPKTPKARPKVYKCTEEGCDKSYSRPSLLIQHLRSHSNERPFICPAINCGKSFLRDSHLKAHMLSHTDTKPLSCDVCGKGFNTNQHLNRHRKTHYPSHVCTYPGCNTSFRRHLQLRKHISDVHTKEKAFKCTHEDCAAAFDQKSRLDVHITKSHSPFPRYQCGHETCDKKFSLWSSLQQHIKNDHKRIPCALCGKPCTGPDGIEQHLQQVHPESEVASVVLASINATTIVGEQASQGSSKRSATRRWMCSEVDCNLFFSRKYLLLDHYKEEHGFIPEHLRHRSSRSNTPTSITNEHDLELDLSDASLADHTGRIQLKFGDMETTNISPQIKRQKTNNTISKINEKKPTGNSDSRNTSMIDIITGAAYESASRNIHCLIDGCPYKFFRDYDLKRHLETVHKAELFNVPIIPVEQSLSTLIPDNMDHIQRQHHHHQQQQQHHLQLQLEQQHHQQQNPLPHQQEHDRSLQQHQNNLDHQSNQQQHLLQLQPHQSSPHHHPHHQPQNQNQHLHQNHQHSHQHHHHHQRQQNHENHAHEHSSQNPIGFNMESLQHTSALNGTNEPSEVIAGFGVIDLSDTGDIITCLNDGSNNKDFQPLGHNNHVHSDHAHSTINTNVIHEHDHGNRHDQGQQHNHSHSPDINHGASENHVSAIEIDPLLLSVASAKRQLQG
ncbi:hypothetical protein NADFUDRAFT_50781 [Nadsonia fulvescens var. elongata DSM 6958]|uniref:C2H2-type domain-containing protein n=1 Tax=Nadsonia fulvescens var. elongata DSM 6958 TaxID=857566 RepID=A0A1E3PJ90_9ASCO|nr:hypothetical protein NADFUDRAFT_50781 [Nadsonia fulvescens var. elongata DSM 6958]